MSGLILVLNAGSSSVKFEVFEAPSLHQLWSGQMEGIGAAPHFMARDADRHILTEWRGAAGHHGVALGIIIEWLKGALAGRPILAIGHRVVHGGPDFATPVTINGPVLRRLDALASLAPLHQPSNLAGIRAAREHFPSVPQIACFDTAFHRGHPWEADSFALPAEFHARGIRRYGFHGLSYEYIARRLAAEAPALGRGRLIVAHLGNGASLCAIRDGRSLDSTMGFTALDGVPMGTRCGRVDPGVVLHLIQAEGLTPAEVSRLLYKESGLKGLSGLSQDVRDLEASDRPEASLALSYFAWHVRREIGALAAVLGGLDALVFTAGIGENSAQMRGRICEGLGFLGIKLDPQRNADGAAEISMADAPVKVLVRSTDEERMIAEHVLAILATRDAVAA